MRFLTPTERGYLTDPEGHNCFVRAEVTNADGTWTSLSDVVIGSRSADFLTTFNFSDNQDANSHSITITLLRNIGAFSLSPFRTDSPLNVDDASSYAPLADLHRQWRVLGCILPVDTFPSDLSDYREWWTGFTDRIDVQGDPAIITLQGRGKEADIIDARVVDVPKTYAADDLGPWIQTALDGQFGGGTVPLTVDGSAPAFFVNARDLGPADDMGLMDLITETAALPGALTRYKYDASDVLSFTLFSPNRNPSTPDWSTDGGEYEKLDVGIGLDAVRNYIIVRYMDATYGLQTVTSPVTPVSASITRYGLRVMVIDLAASTTITDQTAAGNLADAIRSDLEFPIIEHTLTGRAFWFAELGDYVQLAANGVQYDQDQFGGITSIQHTYANGELTSVLGLRAKPSGRYRGWLDFGPGAPRTLFKPGITKYSADYWETYDVDGITLTGAGVMDLGEVNQYTRSVAVEVSTDSTFGTVEFIEYTDVAASSTFTHQWAGASRASIYYFRATPWSGPLDGGGMPTGIAGPPALARTWNTPQVPTKPAFDGAVADIATNTAAIAALAALDFLVKTASGALSAERVVTDTTTIETDWSTAGQANFKIVSSAPLPGSPTTTTQSPGDNSTKVATTAYVDTGLALKADLASPTFTGDPKAPTPSPGDNDTSIATTAFVTAAVAAGGGGGVSDGDKGDIVVSGSGSVWAIDSSVALSGNPTTTTQSAGNNSTRIATTAYVDAAVSAAANGITANTQTASYTLVLGDAGKVIEMNVGSANTLTVPPNSSVAFPVGTVIEVYQMGAGQTTLTPGSGVTFRNPAGATLRAQYSTVSLRKRATDEWVISGDVT